MPKAIVDGVEVEFEHGMSVLQVAELAGAEIPRFCYHDRLSVAGNCRMCLVEVEDQRGRAPKPAASCALPCSDGLMVHTRTDKVKKAREGVMEFLLLNHPLDCPICDQGGECDLQDQAQAFGRDGSRFAENKRAVEEKYMGPLIKTIMTRCIQCTRCVRFATEVAGTEDIGLLNRGEHAEISTIERAVQSEMSGNLVDICPVGALTSKPYAFTARPWELRKTSSIDAMDAVGANIRIDARGRSVLRVLPRLHEDVNEEWIADKSRHAIDGLSRQRLDQPYMRSNGRLRPASWDDAFAAIAAKFKETAADRIAAIAGDQCDAESMFALKSLMDAKGVKNLDCRQDGAALATGGNASGWRFNTTIAGLEEADAILLIGSNPRWEAPLINARIRKRFLTGELQVFGVGAPHDLSYQTDWVGAGPQTLSEILAGKGAAAKALKAASKPVIIVGQGALTREDGAAVLNLAGQVAEKFGAIQDDFNGFNVLHTAAARVAGLDMGFLPGEGGRDMAGILAGAQAGEIDMVYLLGADEFDTEALRETFVVYQGHHGDAGASVADVILPGSAYTEKNGLYVNTEGRVQTTRLATFAPGDAREDWTILRALSGALGQPLGFDDLEGLRQSLIQAVPHMGGIDQIAPVEWALPGAAGDLSDAPFEAAVGNYYMTCPISRTSQTMAECTEVYLAGSLDQAREAAE